MYTCKFTFLVKSYLTLFRIFNDSRLQSPTVPIFKCFMHILFILRSFKESEWFRMNVDGTIDLITCLFVRSYIYFIKTNTGISLYDY